MVKVDIRNFDYAEVAANEAAMWRAYYNHRFFKLFLQLLRLIRSQLGLNWIITLRMAYYAAWAAAYYRLYRHRGVRKERVLKNLQKFSKLISDNAVQPFDYKKAARYELASWDVHRKSYANNPELELSLAQAASVVYNTPAKSLSKYAHFRAETSLLPQHEGDKQANPTDWQKVNELLLEAWRELYVAVGTERKD